MTGVATCIIIILHNNNCETMLLAFTYYYVQKDCIVYFVTTVDSICSKSVSCWVLHDCTVPFPLANTQTAATILNMVEYEKKYSHTKIKIINNKGKMCDIDNNYIVIDNNYHRVGRLYK